MLLRTSGPPRLAIEPRRRRAVISLTPLIDVVFILLVFFMLASSFLDWRSIVLDSPAQAAGSASMEGALLVEVRPEGLRLSGLVMPIDALASRIAESVSQQPGRRVLVKPSAGVLLQRVVDILDRLSAEGVTGMSVIRDRGA